MDFPSQIVIIGVDGATMDLIRPWASEGRLSCFQHLTNNGVSGELQSTIPPVTAPAWTSFMTGKNPGKHNLFDFIEHPEGTYEIKYTSSLSRRSRTIWQLLSDFGKRIGVINVPMTYPPEEIASFFISGLDTPDESSDFIRPPELRQELESVFGKVKLDIRHLGHMRNDRYRDKVLEELIALEEQRKNIALYLLAHYDVDVFMTVFNSPDQVQHHFWHYMDDSHIHYDRKGHKKYGDAIYRVYKKIDENLKEIMRNVRENAVFIIMSDHGAGPVGSIQVFLNNYLKKIGVLEYKTGEERKGNFQAILWKTMKEMELLLKRHLSTKQKMLIAKLFPQLRNRFESYLSLSQIDWDRTSAYAIEILSTSPNIWINLKGKRPHGIVEYKDYDNLLDYIVEKLYELKDQEGNRVIKKIYKKNDVYKGPFIDNAPDLILDWWTGEGFTSRTSASGHNGDIFVRDNKQKLRGGIEWSGTHKINGVFMAMGYPFKQNFILRNAHIVDIAPTVLYLAGLPIPEDMDGRVLFECIDEDFIKKHPISFSKDDGTGYPVSRRGQYSEDEAEKVKKRLRGLGYMS